MWCPGTDLHLLSINSPGVDDNGMFFDIGFCEGVCGCDEFCKPTLLYFFANFSSSMPHSAEVFTDDTSFGAGTVTAGRFLRRYHLRR